MKKKLLSLALVLGMVASLFAGCGGKDSKETETTKTNAGNEETDKEGAKDPYKDMNAIQFTEVMGNGINLGNTMEAYGHSSFGVSSPTTVYETAWGAPVTTAEMVQGMKDAGFDSIRIPVAWTNMMDFENDNYTINEAYLKRVGEIIQYAIDADMIVVVNDHWDGGWWGMFGSETEATREKAMTLYTEMWTQIAEYYKDFDSRLVFESANEELGNSLNDNSQPWSKDSGSLSEDECYEVSNAINQKFVDIVRSSGGYNKDRFLLIAGINTNIEKTCDDRFVMPKDTAKDKLIVSVHYYDPSGYCIFGSVGTWGTKREVENMNATLATLTKFTDAGYGVIIGEWGVLDETGSNTMAENTLDYYKNFIANCDYYGYCPMLWDTGFMYNRNECKMRFTQIGNFFANKSYSQIQSQQSTEDIKAAGKAVMDIALENAKEGDMVGTDVALAWIMYTSSDWSVSYRVGDDYNTGGMTDGVVANDVEITGPGTYTVSVDFTGTGAGKGTGVTFSALGIFNGETLFPGYYINIKEVRINGEAVELTGKTYTTSDDSKCTRVNLYNSWVTKLPDEARVADGDLTGCTWTPIDATKVTDVKTIEVDFEYVAP